MTVDPDSLVNLSVVENPNSVLAIMGRDVNSNVNLRLPVSALEEVEIRSIKDSECSIDSILSLDCQTLSSAGRRALEFAAGNSTDDYNYYTIGDDFVKQYGLQSTALMLQNSQSVVLVGVNGSEVAKNPQAFFSVQDLSADLPTSLPTNQPSSKPSYHPTAGILMTDSPSSQPITQPSAQPSRKPFINPSAIPSYKPTEIPSFNPRSQPTSHPSQEPSAQLTSNPSGQPSSRPTSTPSSRPSHHPIAGDLETSNPSSRPSINPSQSPSFKPQEIPNLILLLISHYRSRHKIRLIIFPSFKSLKELRLL